MHTHSHTHTLLQQGLLYYNRRIPKVLGGGLIRIKLPDSSIAETLSKRIEAAWAMGYSPDPALILVNIMEETKPLSLDEIAEDYIRIRQISPKPVLISIKMLMNVAGQKPLVDYNRADVRSFLIKSKEVGHKTTTIRRRLNSLSAVFNFAYHEYEIDRRNPFAKVWIEGEGEDSFSRVPFKLSELESIYRHSVEYGGVRSMFPILGETGCRLAEIVGLRVDDYNQGEGVIHIRENRARRLKTTGSRRSLPVGAIARDMLDRIRLEVQGEWMFPQYIKGGVCTATHTSNTLNKWLKKSYNGKTVHCFRHALRDRLRAVECPLELIDQIGGWSSVGGSGAGYGLGYSIEHKKEWLAKIWISDKLIV